MNLGFINNSQFGSTDKQKLIVSDSSLLYKHKHGSNINTNQHIQYVTAVYFSSQTKLLFNHIQ